MFPNGLAHFHTDLPVMQILDTERYYIYPQRMWDKKGFLFLYFCRGVWEALVDVTETDGSRVYCEWYWKLVDEAG